MTIGEKIKEGRTKAGLTQEQFAEKLCVSRQAIAKWENGRGLPDVENLKSIATLLGVSVDYLLDEERPLEADALKEVIDWEKYPKDKWFAVKEDAVVLDKYPEAVSIVELARTKKKSRAQKILDWFFLLFTHAPDSGADLVNMLEDLSRYYLVEEKDGYRMVNITREYCISRRLPAHKVTKKIEIGQNIFKSTKRKIGKKEG